MRIADVCEFYSEGGGGIRTYVNSKLRAAARLGHDVTVIAPRPAPGVTELEGGRIVWIKSPPMPGDPRYAILLNGRAVHRALDAWDPQLVEGSSFWQGGVFAAQWKRPVPKVMVFHQDFVAVIPHTYMDRYLSRGRIDQLFTPLWWHIKRLSCRYDATLVSGHWLAKRLSSFGVNNPVVIPFGVDKELFSAAKADPDMRRQMAERCGVAPEDPILVTVSRLHPEKRFPTLFHGFRRLTAERPMGWVIFGDGVTRPKVERLCRENPGAHLWGYTDHREQLASAMASADVLYHGSAAETFGLVVAESLCAGLPVVVPDVGGAFDLAHPGCSAVYEAGNGDAAAAAVTRLLETPRADIAKACEEAKVKIWTMDGHFDRLFAYYQSLISR
ncbi:MAG: glycosyltransferase [Pseudomonadota bacterium]